MPHARPSAFACAPRAGFGRAPRRSAAYARAMPRVAAPVRAQLPVTLAQARALRRGADLRFFLHAYVGALILFLTWLA